MMLRRRALVTGAVQGVGFRPFVARLARAEQLGGFVRNHSGNVTIEIEGSGNALERFGRRLHEEAPTAANIATVAWCDLRLGGAGQTFRIEASDESEATSLVLPPDLAVCDECLVESRTPGTRRFNYGFGSCTACGPRFTIARATPWDRTRTSMASFPMCAACSEEYQDPSDRRNHAQTIACPQCGPGAMLFGLPGGAPIAEGSDALRRAADTLKDRGIVALKGIGGFLLLVRADDEASVEALRRRKRRPGKPMAVLIDTIAKAEELAYIGAAEKNALESPAAPIVLCRARPGSTVAHSVTKGIGRIGLMLPSTPLHALLCSATGLPLVATSGNRHEEPLCTSSEQAVETLGEIADVVLGHNRDILRPCDDSVVDCIDGKMRVLRRARGLAPHAIELGITTSTPLLALGGHLKVAPALAMDGHVIQWPHTGNLDTALARTCFGEAVTDLESFFGTRATRLACDAHPDYATTIWAEKDGRPFVRVQHHHAHIAACLAEWKQTQCLGVAWDGIGYGDDGSETGTMWGGEFLEVGVQGARRVHHWLPFPLIGGDAAARDGRRALAGMCFEAGIAGPEKFLPPEILRHQQAARLAPRTTSVGRMFDAVAALTGVCEHSTFEGEAAMRLEAIAMETAEPYPLAFSGPVLDWRPMLVCMVAERNNAVRVASRFHATLTSAVLQIAQRRNASLVALTGGCFQNRRLLQDTTTALEHHKIRTITPMQLPPGDGGLALGQAWVALQHESSKKQ